MSAAARASAGRVTVIGGVQADVVIRPVTELPPRAPPGSPRR